MMLFLLSFSKKITLVLLDLGTRLLFNRQNSVGLCILQDALTYLVQFCNPQDSAGRKTGWCFSPPPLPFVEEGTRPESWGARIWGERWPRIPQPSCPERKMRLQARLLHLSPHNPTCESLAINWIRVRQSITYSPVLKYKKLRSGIPWNISKNLRTSRSGSTEKCRSSYIQWSW